VLLNEGSQLVLVGSRARVEQLAVLEELKGGHTTHIGAIGQILELIHINVDEHHIRVL